MPINLKERLATVTDVKSTVIKVETHKLHKHPENDNIYGDFDPDKNTADKELISHVSEMGVLQPLLVRPDIAIDGEYVIISGHRRFEAAKRAGIKKLECKVYHTPTAEDLIKSEIALIITNQNREKDGSRLNPREYIFIKSKLLELKKIVPDAFKGVNIREAIAETLGTAERTIATTEKIINNLPEEEKKQFLAGEMTQEKAHAIADTIVKAKRAPNKTKRETVKTSVGNNASITVPIQSAYSAFKCALSQSTETKQLPEAKAVLEAFEALLRRLKDEL